MPGQVQEKIQMPPHAISQFMFGPWALQALQTAVELDLFSTMANGPADTKTVAERSQSDLRGIMFLLDALTGMQVLEKSGMGESAQHVLTDAARVYLLPSSDLYMGDYALMHAGEVGKMWQNLTQVIRTGKSMTALNQQGCAEDFFPKLAAWIFPLNFVNAQLLAEALKVENLPAGAKVLDLAAGAAVWSIPMAKRNPGLSVDALDFPATLETTRRYVEKYEVEKQFAYLPGSWQQVDLPANQYDMVLLGHIMHSEGKEESERMFAKILPALKPGGRLVIAEFLTNNEKNGPMFSLLFGINMYLVTETGTVFSEQEVFDMLTRQGYINPQRVPLPFFGPESPIIMAEKA